MNFYFIPVYKTEFEFVCVCGTYGILKHMPKKKMKFVTKFLSIMQRFPVTSKARISRDDLKHVNMFFIRVACFCDGSVLTLDPYYLLSAFVLANFPAENFTCVCNPFNCTLFHRSVDFVGACFQVVIDSSESEDDGRLEFIPRKTALNFAQKLTKFMEAFDAYLGFSQGGWCSCGKCAE